MRELNVGGLSGVALNIFDFLYAYKSTYSFYGSTVFFVIRSLYS